MNLDVVYSDAHLAVLNKPSGLLSVPGRGDDKQDCLINRLRGDFPGVRLVHRLDTDTSGVVCFALTHEAQANLGQITYVPADITQPETLTAAIAVDALGAENVVGIGMPSPYSSRGSIDDAVALAKTLTTFMKGAPKLKIKAAVLVSGKSDSFIAGADIDMLKGLTTDSAQAHPRLVELIDDLLDIALREADGAR